MTSAVGAEPVGAALQWGRETLLPSATASLDAQLLLGHVLRRSRAWILAHAEEAISATEWEVYADLIFRRSRGEPVAYLRGFVEWFDTELRVTKDVLIPRPETELLVEQATELVARHDAQVLADVGTGSGAIAIQLARSAPGTTVYAIDVCPEALDVARWNVNKYGLQDQVVLQHADLLSGLSKRPDVIVANLPYLAREMMAELDADVRHEPVSALFGGEDGLELYRRMFDQIRDRGWTLAMAMEIDPRQATRMTALLARYFPTGLVRLVQDYAGHVRIVVFEPKRCRND